MPKVPVHTLQKRKKRLLSQAREARDRIKQKSSRKSGSKKQSFLRAEKFVKNYRKISKDKLRIRRQAKFLAIDPNTSAESQDHQSKLGLVVRLAPSIPMTAKCLSVLNQLDLTTRYSAAFIQLTPENVQKIQLIEPYVTWGTPSLKTVRELIFKRGHCKVPHDEGSLRQFTEITDNAIIEKQLGHLGIICIEDLVHEIFTSGENFEPVNRFLSHFRLNKPESRLKMKASHFAAGGTYGHRGDAINQLVQAMI